MQNRSKDDTTRNKQDNSESKDREQSTMNKYNGDNKTHTIVNSIRKEYTEMISRNNHENKEK